MMRVQCYERKPRVWIGTGEDGLPVDIVIPGLLTSLLLRKDSFLLKREAGGECRILLNGQAVREESGALSEGDELELYTEEGTVPIRINLFEETLEVEGAEGSYQASLLPVRPQGEYFPDFPHYKRSPRVNYHIEDQKIIIEAPPQKKEMAKGGLVQVIVPPLCMLALTIAMGILMNRGPYVFMSAGMTLITTIFSVQKFFSDRKERNEQNARREEMYEEYLLRMRKRIRKARAEEKEALAYQNPKFKDLAEMVNRYSSRIYERTALDDDFLTVNLGFHQGRSRVEVSFSGKELEIKKDELTQKAEEIAKEFRLIEDVPVVVDLKRAHLGLVGSKANVHEQLKYLLAQVTCFQSYHELQILHIHDAKYKERFDYARWYPHLRIRAINVVGDITDEQARDQILGSIQQILKERKMKLEEGRQETVFLPHLLFIIDEPKLILNHAIMEYLQGKDMNLGFSMIYTSERTASLPENVRTVCLIKNSQQGELLLNEGRKVGRQFDTQHAEGIDLEWSARTSSALIHEQGISSRIPESITFFDMYYIEHPEELQVKERWKKNESHKSLAVPLGVRAEEDYVELNLHEKAHGPHGLVAGTTGSGKSEIVQSYILSLAVNFHPHEVGFLLIDYKGGGMANLFAKLPHLLGTITNLDKAESMRAMASIKSEMARRQRIFGEHNVNHINGYNKLFKLGKVEEPLPHLFLISDEFAELKKEQPEFMTELVSAARIGRSLGIHLILATQKPTGVVDDQIWTNSKFKLCLKVQNEGDSKEMLKTPDAANITQAGRAYLQVGNNEIYELFQSAWSGASYDREQKIEDKEDDRVYLVNALGQGELLNQDLSGSDSGNKMKKSQLDVIVDYIHDAYETLDAAEVKKPWLPPLEEKILSPYTQTVADCAGCEELDLTLGLGMTDFPEEQSQKEYVLDLEKNGHLLYMASSGYGKSMLLTHIILGLSMKNAVRNLNFYIVDLGNSALIAMTLLPHAADYIGIDDSEKMGKFQKLILGEIAERKKKLAQAMAQNFHVYNQSQKEKLKAIIIVLDNYDVVGELGDEAVTFFQKTARDGAGLGIYLIVTITRDGAMRSSMKGNFKERIAGFNFSESEVSSFLGRSKIKLPEEKKGRALVKLDAISLMQLYTPVDFKSELDYRNQVKELIGRICDNSSEEKAPGIPVLPETFVSLQMGDYPCILPDIISLGLEIEDVQLAGMRRMESPFLIIGPGGSGKTNALYVMLEQFIRDSRVYLFESRKKDCLVWKQSVHYLDSEGLIEDAFEDLSEEISRRRKGFEAWLKEYPQGSVEQYYRGQERIVLAVNEVEDLVQQTEEKQCTEFFQTAVEAGMEVVFLGESSRLKGRDLFTKYVRSSVYGLVLGDQGVSEVFQVGRSREVPKKVEEGLLFRRGRYIRLLLPRWEQEGGMKDGN